MASTHYPPRKILVLLGLQFFGLFLLILAHEMTSPLGILLSYALGTVIVGINILFWLFLGIRKALTRLRIQYPPRPILHLLGLQLCGLCLFILAHFASEPLTISLPYALGVFLVGGGILYWLVRLFLEKDAITKDLRAAIRNNTASR